jgi:hypothetical protein
MYRSMRSFLRDAQHNRLLAVPAGLYAVNNYLKFAMQLYFKPTTAKMLGNLKVPVVPYPVEQSSTRANVSICGLKTMAAVVLASGV